MAAAPPTHRPRVASNGSPGLALLLGWFLPGAGHVYLGKLRLGLLLFLGIEGLYVLGVVLSGGMFLEYLPPEMRSAFAGALTPEAGNLGALLVHINHFGYGIGSPRPYPEWMDVGTTLTALSGLFNIFAMSSAHLLARNPEVAEKRATRPGPSPALAAAANWIVPGLGQILQGRKGRGLLIAGMLLSLFAVACILGEGANLDRERHFYYWAGQFMLGAPALLVEFYIGHPRLSFEIAYADAATVLGCVAGMLNVLVMLDAYSFAEDGPLGQSTEGASDPASMRGAS